MEKQFRRYEKVIGICFLLATVTYAIGNQMIENGVHGHLELSSTRLGIVFELINSFAVVIIGWMSSKVLKSYNKSIIKGYMFARFIEGFLLAFGAISVLLLSQANIELILKLRELCFSLAMLSLGAFSSYYCWYLLKKRLAPKWMMGLGIIGYLCLLIYSIITLISELSPIWLFTPGGFFELIFPIYLIIKGLNRSRPFNDSLNNGHSTFNK
ncbi:DUF4386 domain-containing protein [Metabacillus litoralis]|uniref:DUF4386 domain-containing protein n=1 Tax=Metabacillus litoralis TaxID=152268 RepID=UPI0020418F8E|nr:DUF4386 domain-containing protein [Metabacillus litoralis]MCM3411750.1 DUF4386 domain-containing protein [Metabacillus litoralis]